MDPIKSEYTRKIATYSAHFSFDAMPVNVVRSTKLVVLDTMGALVAASPNRFPAVRIIGDLVETLGGKPECTVPGRSFKTSVLDAALVLGTMGYAADIEGAEIARIHAPAVFVPAAIAMGEKEDLNGRDFIASIVLAYDIAARISEASRTTRFNYAHSFHPSPVFGTFGAAAVGGYDLHLSSAEFANAYGLAGLIASGLICWIYDSNEQARPFVVGVATRNGIMAALLAERGFSGPEGILDAQAYSIYDAFTEEMHLDELTKGLGKDFWIEKALEFKMYPCCGDLQPGVHAILKIVTENDLRPEEIEEIVHIVKEERCAFTNNNPIRSHNAQYMLAVAAVNRQLQWDDFLVDRRSDPRIRRLYRIAKQVGSSELDNLGQAAAIVRVKTKSGKVLTEKVAPTYDGLRWNTGIPITQRDLEDKFLKISTPLIGQENAEQIVKRVRELENLKNVADLTSIIKYQ